MSLQRGLTVTVRLGEVDTIEYHRDRGLSVTVYFGKSKGSASTADLRPAAVRETVVKASAIAQHTAADDCAGLADPQAQAREIPDLDLYHPWDIEPQQAVQLARECEAAGLSCDPRLKNSEGATVTTHSGVRVHGNSQGFLAGFPSTSHSVSCALVAQERQDMQRDYWFSVARNPVALESASAIGKRAARRALQRLGARRLTTAGRAGVVRTGAGARGVWTFHRRHQRHQPVSSLLVPAQCGRRAGVSVVPEHRRTAAPAAGAGEQPVRRRRASRPMIASW